MSRTTHPGWNDRRTAGAHMQRAAAPPPAPTSPWVWILGTVLVLGVVGMVGAFIIINRILSYAPKGPSVEEAGYSWLPKCGGVVVQDEPKAMAYAYAAGQRSTPFDITSPTAWLLANVASLGTAYCDPKNFPVTSLGFVYRLFRSYILGAEKGGKMPAGISSKMIASIRDQIIARGVPVAELPE